MRAKAQRRPKGQDAGGTPALPGDAVPAVRWGVSGGRLLRKPTCTLWETPVCPRAGPRHGRADHSRKNGRSLMKTNHEWTRMNRRDTKTDRPPSTTSGTKMPLQFCALGVTSCPWWITPSIGFRQAGSPPCRADHTRVKQRTFMAYGDQGLCFVNPVVCIGNIDRQDKHEPFAKFGVGHEMGAECSCKITPSKGICTWLAMGFPLGARASRPHTCQGAAPASVGG